MKQGAVLLCQQHGSLPANVGNDMDNANSHGLNGELLRYRLWLIELGLSTYTQRAYLSRVQQFFLFLSESGGAAINWNDERELSAAIFSYWESLKQVKKATLGTVNNNLTALDNFCQFIGMKHVKATSLREKTPISMARTLSVEEQVRFLNAVNRRRSRRDKALALILFSTGLKIGECSALNIGDAVLTSHTGKLRVRSSGQKKGSVRELTLDEVTRKALLDWLTERAANLTCQSELPLFLNSQGKRLGIAGIDFLIRSIGWSARVDLSSQILRRTFLVNQVSVGQTADSLAQMAGLSSPQTIRRYVVNQM
jgi:integrase/recombinase XerD